MTKMSQIFDQKGKITPMKKLFTKCWTQLWAWTVVALVCGAIALVLGFIIGLSYKAYLFAFHLWV